MGFSSEAIFVKTQITDDLVKKITAITHGDSDVVFNREISFDEIASGSNPGIFFGQMNESFYMIYNGMGYNIPDDRFNEIQDVFAHLFPKEEILYITNVESANAYAYHLIKGGQTVRKKVGAHPVVVEDIGEELEIEKAYYVKKEERDGQVYYYTKSHYKEGELDEWTHDQIGGDIAFKLVKDMTGCVYMSQDTDNFKAKQYFTRQQLHDAQNFLEGKTDKPQPILRSGLPMVVIKELIETARKVLEANGFKETDPHTFTRSKDKLNQVVRFQFDTSAKEFSSFTFFFNQNIGYVNWHKEQFGTDVNPNGQRIFDQYNINFNHLGLADKHQTLFFDGNKTKKELEDGLVERLTDCIIPAFDKSEVNQLTQSLIGIRKVDFHLMNNEIEKAKIECISLRDVLIKMAVEKNWAEDQKDKYFEMMEARNKFFDEPIEYREYYEANLDRITKEVEEEQRLAKIEQEKRQKEFERQQKEEEIRRQEQLRIEEEEKARIAKENEKAANQLHDQYEAIAKQLGPAKMAIINEYGPLSSNELKQAYSSLTSLPESKRPTDFSTRIEVLASFAQTKGISEAATWTQENQGQKKKGLEIVGDHDVEPEIVEIANEYKTMTLNDVKIELLRLNKLSKEARPKDYHYRIKVLEMFARKGGITNIQVWLRKSESNKSLIIFVVVVLSIFILLKLIGAL
jgi:hypothetical protein